MAKISKSVITTLATGTLITGILIRMKKGTPAENVSRKTNKKGGI